MSDRIALSGVTINAPDALELARSYARITGGVTAGSAQRATVSGPGGDLGFQGAEGFVPPTWPTGPAPMPMHLDVAVDDLAATERRVLEAGATKFDFPPDADHCFVHADPVGHPFCLTTWSEPRL